jgi:tetratricopeptide (TPR) repeat protein/transglutaminase-like putative cysteine protease
LIPPRSVVSQGRVRVQRGLGIAVLALLFASATTSTRLTGAQLTSAPGSPPYVIEEMITHHQVQADGSGRKRIYAKVKVANQAGVTAWSTLMFPYMSAIEEVSIHQLMVEKPDGRQVKASASALEDAAPPSEIDTTILSDYRAKKIAVPALEAGDRLIYDVVFTRSASLIPGQFWFDHNFTSDAVVMHETLEVDAPSSRALNVRARRGSEVPPSPTAAGRIVRRWTHQQMVARTPPTTDEAIKALSEDLKQGPDVRVSSFQNWDQLGGWFAGVIDAKTAPDESVRARARELTRGLDTPEQRLAALYSFVSTQIRYISLAFGTGRLEPRSASQVLATQYGDCKDKHVLLASLARAIDLDIKPVLISSVATLDDKIPTPSQFDHMISVRTAADTAAWHWMDSTSGALPPGVLLEPLRDKRALLVPTSPIGGAATAGAGAAGTSDRAARAAAIVTTPVSSSETSRITVDITSTMTLDRLTSRVVRRITGDLEYALRMMVQAASAPQTAYDEIGKEQAEEDNFGKPTTVTNTVLKDEGLGKGVVLSYEASRPLTPTYDKAWEIWLTAPRLQPSLMPEDTAKEVELAQLDITLTVKYEVPANVRARPPVPVSLDREFASYTSSYKVDGQTLSQERRLRTRMKKVTAEQMDSYRAFLRAIDSDFGQKFAIDAIPRTAATPQTADELGEAGYAAMQKRQYKEAIELLRRATTLDPKNKRSWNNLGSSYNSLREFASAKEAFERAIALNPYDEYANRNLANALWGLKRTDEAIAQFKKQIEIVPLDKWSHAQLGRLYLELKRHDEAAESLERAVGITPNDGRAWFGLGTARLERNEADEAVKAFGRAAELTSTPAMWNEVAWAFAEKGVKLDVAKDYVRKAIDAINTSLQNVTLEQLVPAQVAAAEQQAHYWDTLGWIYFQSGDFVSAEKWVRAAWLLGQHPEIGEHLAMIYEKQGKRARALDLYAQSAGVGSAHKPSRAALERLVGADEAEMQITLARAALVEQRTIKLPRLVPGSARADVVLLMTADGRITQIRFVKGDERLHTPVTTLKALKAPALQPDAQTLSFARAGMIGCAPSTGCVLVLMRPADAPPPATPPPATPPPGVQ